MVVIRLNQYLLGLFILAIGLSLLSCGIRFDFEVTDKKSGNGAPSDQTEALTGTISAPTISNENEFSLLLESPKATHYSISQREEECLTSNNWNEMTQGTVVSAAVAIEYNSENEFFVKFKNEIQRSPCYKHSVLHDNIAPSFEEHDVLNVNPTQALGERRISVSNIKNKVLNSGSRLSDIEISFNRLNGPFESFDWSAIKDKNSYSIPEITGTDEFSLFLRLKDEAGNTSSTHWSPYYRFTSNGVVQSIGEKGVAITRLTFLDRADLDSDGKMDIIARGGGSVHDFMLVWMRNDGKGNFASHLLFKGLTRNENALITGDFLGKGWEDIVVASSSDQRLTIYTHDGNYQFSSSLLASTPAGEMGLESSDFDQDGDLDIVATFKGASILSIFENQGNGSFSRIDLSTTTTGLSDPVVMDYDGDGAEDIIVYSSDSDDIFLFKNELDGNFIRESILPGLAFLQSFLVDDFNSDGYLDIIGCFPWNDRIDLYQGSSGGSFSQSTISSVEFPYAIEKGDFNGDGLSDFVFVSFDRDEVLYYLNRGDSEFNLKSASPFSSSADWVGAIPIDVDSNSIDELVFSIGNNLGYDDTKLGRFQEDETFQFERLNKNHKTTFDFDFADLNGDGRVELVTHDYWKGIVSFMQQGMDGSWENVEVTDSLQWGWSVATGDFNNDGRVDVVGASAYSVGWPETLVIYLNQPDGSFVENVIESGSSRTLVEAADLNGDNVPELVVASIFSNSVFLYRNNGLGSFTRTTLLTGFNRPEDITFFDLDGDGDLDIITTASSGNRIHWLENDGSAGFVNRVVSSSIGRPLATDAGDFNNDGSIDLVTISDSSNALIFLENDGSENFSSTTVGTGFIGVKDLEVVDFDDDSQLDVVVTDIRGKEISLWRGAGDGSFSKTVLRSEIAEPRGIKAFDISGDGSLDLLWTSRTGHLEVLYRWGP